jgi:hypothetical protein
MGKIILQWKTFKLLRKWNWLTVVFFFFAIGAIRVTITDSRSLAFRLGANLRLIAAATEKSQSPKSIAVRTRRPKIR